MKEHLGNNYETILFAGGLTGVTAVFGGWDLAFQVLIICMISDIIFGVTKALVNKDFSSEEMRKGFVTKFGYIIIIVLATQFDRIMPEEFPIIRTMVIYFYIATESSSLIENLALMGVPIPKVVTDRLAQLRGKESDQEIDREEVENEENRHD